MQTNSNTTKHEEEENPLISLLNKNKKAFYCGSLMRVIRRDFDLVKEVREKEVGWKEIVEALGFPGMEARARYSFFYEKRRRAKKEKEVTPEKKKWTPGSLKEKKKESPGLDGPAAEKRSRPRLITKQPGGGTDFFENLPEA